jgi:hypothetical protein
VALELPPRQEDTKHVNRIQAIEGELRKLSPEEIREVREWLEDFVEDQFEFTPEFEAEIQQSECEMAAGVASRTRQPLPGS